MSAADIRPDKVSGREVDEVREIDVDGRIVLRLSMPNGLSSEAPK